MIPVRGSTWSPSEPPACALPRKPCSGPKTATTSTLPDACMVSTMWFRSSRMPVGLLITPAFCPASALHPSFASACAPVVTLPPCWAGSAAPAAWTSISGAAASAPAPASRLRRFIAFSFEDSLGKCSRAEVQVSHHGAMITGRRLWGYRGVPDAETRAHGDEVDPFHRGDGRIGRGTTGGRLGLGPAVVEAPPELGELRRVVLGVEVADQDLQVLPAVPGQDLQRVVDLGEPHGRVGPVIQVRDVDVHPASSYVELGLQEAGRRSGNGIRVLGGQPGDRMVLRTL